jgi:hypothetical protein
MVRRTDVDALEGRLVRSIERLEQTYGIGMSRPRGRANPGTNDD